MANDRLTFAINRLERALGQAERALETARPAASGSEDPDLARRHQLLREEMRIAIKRIDQVISTAGDGHNG